MTLQSKSKTISRTFIAVGMDSHNKDNWMIIKFLAPNSIKDTSLLTVDIANSDPLQWLYLPALKKTRKISSSGKGRRFVASDIFYEDMTIRETKEDTHKRLKNRTYEGMKCFVIESTPIKQSSTSYSKTISWVHPKSFVPVKIQFFRKNKIIKTMYVKEMKQIQGIWTVTQSLFEEEKTNHSTILTIEKIKYNIPITKTFFYKKNIESAHEINKILKYL